MGPKAAKNVDWDQLHVIPNTKQVNTLLNGTEDKDRDEWTQFLVLFLFSSQAGLRLGSSMTGEQALISEE